MNGQPPSPYGAPAAPAPKKSKKGCIAAGCGGCLFVFLCLCVCSGYLLYLEEGVSYSDPGEEVMSQPYVPGTPVALEIPWDGTGYADHRVYLDLGLGAPSGVVISGDFGCTDYGEVATRSVYETFYGSDFADPSRRWVRIDEEYARAPATVRCGGVLVTDQPIAGARLVVTRRQRPSDWLSGVF